MFTGIIEEMGEVIQVLHRGGGAVLTIKAPKSVSEVAVNDSISVNGCCQTVVEKSRETFTVQAVEETLLKTTLGDLRMNSRVNLELAMKLDERLGGHLVLGHVDGVGTVLSVEKKESSWLYTIQIPKQFLRYVIPVGSIGVDGVSLTVARLHDDRVVVSIIPHTYENTIFPTVKEGSSVNLEFDLIGKYIERLMTKERGPGNITASQLKEWGYT